MPTSALRDPCTYEKHAVATIDLFDQIVWYLKIHYLEISLLWLGLSLLPQAQIGEAQPDQAQRQRVELINHP